MNRKVTLLLIAAIAAILPAVAIADVMITGEIGVVGSTNSTVFNLQAGPNYENADGYVTWHSYASGQYMGDLHLNPTANQTVLAINVMEIVFDPGIANGVFWLNLTGYSTDMFPTGSYFYISDSLMAFADFQAPNSLGTPAAGIIAMNLHIANGVTVTSGPIDVTAGTILYIGFYIPGVGPTALNAEIHAHGYYSTA